MKIKIQMIQNETKIKNKVTIPKQLTVGGCLKIQAYLNKTNKQKRVAQLNKINILRTMLHYSVAKL